MSRVEALLRKIENYINQEENYLIWDEMYGTYDGLITELRSLGVLQDATLKDLVQMESLDRKNMTRLRELIQTKANDILYIAEKLEESTDMESVKMWINSLKAIHYLMSVEDEQ